MFPQTCVQTRIRHLIRVMAVKLCKEEEIFSGYTQPVEKIIDKSVVSSNNWFIYGSKKPNGHVYKLKKIYNTNRTYIEQKSSGISIIQELKRSTELNVIPLSPQGKDKITRIMSVQPSLEGGKVILVEDVEWNDMLLSELASFPYGAHDDLTDCLSYSVQQFINKSNTFSYGMLT